MKKVLIVEDDFYIRQLYRMTFEKKGYYEVVEAENGKSALEKIKEADFDFVVLDLMLPDLAGLEVLKGIKKLKDIPVYILTNVGEERALKESIANGAEAYFLKVDYTPKQLVAAIEEKEK